jgi:hypothetical protein
MKLKTYSRLWIALILIATMCALFGAVSNVAAPPLPLYAMKTLGDGKFYVPTIPVTPTSLKIELLFDVALTGDQTGSLGVSPYPTSILHWPDGKVDMKDIAFIEHPGTFGSVPGMVGWDYMADVVPDKKIDLRDVVAVVKHFGGHVPFPGTYPLTWPQPSVTVVFNPSGTRIPDANGFVPILPGDTSFVVQQNNIAIGALVTFWP